MIDKNITEYLQKLGKVTLSTDVKARMRDDLSAFADFHAVAVTESRAAHTQTPFHFFIQMTRPLQASLAIMVLLVGTTGIFFGAQSALPGEVLYGVKVLVQEKIQASLAFDSDAQAQVQADIFAERLEEARTLVLQGKRDVATSKEVRRAIDTQREKTLDAALAASPAIQAAVEVEVVRGYTYTQKILTTARPVLATAHGVSTMAIEPLQSRSAADVSSSFYDIGGAEDTTSMFTTDAKMIPEYTDVYVVEEGDLILPLLSERVVFLQTALLENTVEVPPEIKIEIEKDLNRALTLWYGRDQERSYELVTYIETFLGISLERGVQADAPYMDTDTESDVMRSEPIPMPLPVDVDMSDPGFGVSGNSGTSRGGEIDLMYTEDAALPFESGVVDMGIGVQPELQIVE